MTRVYSKALRPFLLYKTWNVCKEMVSFGAAASVRSTTGGEIWKLISENYSLDSYEACRDSSVICLKQQLRMMKSAPRRVNSCIKCSYEDRVPPIWTKVLFSI